MNGTRNSPAGDFTIGVDIGGTFTDCIVIDDSGRVTIGKAPSTPPNFQTGFVDSMGSAASRLGVSLEHLARNARGIYHGCTVGTNALVEGRTAKTGLITTRGHSDSLFFMKGGSRLWGEPPEYVAHVAAQTKAEPLVPKHLIEEIDERVAFDGAVAVELDVEGCRNSIERLLEAGVEAVAISFLWSVVNTKHEDAVLELVRELAPDVFVCCSSEVIARIGEYERTVATVINSLVGPVMVRYLEDLSQDLTALGYERALHVMSCSGGLIDASYAKQLPVLTIGSGPVAGLIGGGALSRAEGEAEQKEAKHRDVITIDMGGTTLDVGVIREGEPVMRPTSRFDQFEYFIPTLDVRSIGAGGGSIVAYDEDRRTLRVGPQSAGAHPGPAAYQRGGEDATVTDANLVLGYLNPEGFLGGELKVSSEAAHEVLERVGHPLGFGAEEAAAAAIRIVDHQMADAIRLASVQQGFDPRRHVLYAYGGGGPLHATSLAKELGIRDVVVPLSDLASGWSAFGAICSDAIVIKEVPALMAYPFDVDTLNASWEELEAGVLEAMAGQGISSSAIELTRLADLKYTMQVNEIPIKAQGGRIDEQAAASLIESFEREYARLYGEGSGYPDAGFAITAMRVRGQARVSSYRLASSDGGVGEGAPPLLEEREVILYKRGLDRITLPVFDGKGFAPGMVLTGPAIVEYPNTTLLLADEDRAAVDGFGSVMISIAR